MWLNAYSKVIFGDIDLGQEMNISDRLRDLAQDVAQYYSEPITPPREEIRGWAERINKIAAEIEQMEWDQYDAIIARDMEMG